MSGIGNCYDKAAMVAFFKTIKAELIWRHSWETRRDVEIAIFEYIKRFYNPRRRHSTLGWRSPFHGLFHKPMSGSAWHLKELPLK